MIKAPPHASLTLEEKQKYGIKKDAPEILKCMECHKSVPEVNFKNIYWVPYNEHGLKYEGWIICCVKCTKIFEEAILSIGQSFL